MYFHYALWLWIALCLGDSGVQHACQEICFCKQGTLFVNCSGASVSADLILPPETEHLDLSNSNLHSVPRRGLRLLRRLQVLLLSSNHISGMEQSPFISLQRLHKLDICKNEIASLGNSFSVGLIFLYELTLAYNRLQELQYQSFQHFENLQKLNLQNNNISSIQAGAFRSLTRLRQLCLQHNHLATLQSGVFSVLQHLEVLNLEGNWIKAIAPGVFASLSRLTVLNLVHNRIERIRFKTLLALQTPGTRIFLTHNPWYCDCDLQRVFAKLHSVRSLILDDYPNVTCNEPPVLRSLPLLSVETQLCIAETVTVLVITATVCITVVAAIVMAERNRKKRTGKHWSEDSEVSYHIAH
ncbi:Leucine-rich repeat-containing protein 15 [Varanus komodoensis]|uniref:toll-like receptor 7 n=1 Tax=Varanus komodoensis TaxID=61221 RepID=UPI001CF7E650|nr:toll-like receptor 7 [Varanus komodoensis]KAF7237502.1 Leucine-rich repeat-containing protein 15 [Varanus komodoensis]